MKKALLILGVVVNLSVFAQMTEIKYRVTVNEKVKVKQALDTAVFGSNGKYRELNLSGKANIKSSETSDSLFINYWLDPKIPKCKTQTIRKYTRLDTVSKTVAKSTDESPLGETDFRGEPLSLEKFKIIKPYLNKLWTFQDNLADKKEVSDSTEEKLQDLKDTLAVLSDTLIFPKRSDVLYNAYRTKYTQAYQENLRASNEYKEAKKSYKNYLAEYQKILDSNDLSWFPIDSNNIFTVNNDKGEIVKYYAVKYDRNTDYTIRLENRQFQPFLFGCWEIGAVTIPLKYRFSFNNNGFSIPDEVSADINAGVFGGRSFGRISYRYRRNGSLTPNITRFTLGGFANVSRVELDSSSTYSDTQPLTSKRTIGALSVGGGLVVSAYDFRIGLFVGTDIGVGNVSRKWDYNGKPWVGVGVGYNLESITFGK